LRDAHSAEVLDRAAQRKADAERRIMEARRRVAAANRKYLTYMKEVTPK